jgi:hypothetical protein
LTLGSAAKENAGMEVMMLLLYRRSEEVAVTEKVVKAAAANDEKGKLLRRIHDFSAFRVTKGTVQAAATSRQSFALRFVNK